MNFATRFLATLGAIMGMGQLRQPITPSEVKPIAPEPGQLARYLTRGGMPRRRYYVLPRLPGGESYTNTSDRRMVSADLAERIEADAVIKRGRRATKWCDQSISLRDMTRDMVHSPGLFTVAQRLDVQARRAERKALARGEIK